MRSCRVFQSTPSSEENGDEHRRAKHGRPAVVSIHAVLRRERRLGVLVNTSTRFQFQSTPSSKRTATGATSAPRRPSCCFNTPSSEENRPPDRAHREPARLFQSAVLRERRPCQFVYDSGWQVSIHAVLRRERRPPNRRGALPAQAFNPRRPRRTATASSRANQRRLVVSTTPSSKSGDRLRAPVTSKFQSTPSSERRRRLRWRR